MISTALRCFDGPCVIRRRLGFLDGREGLLLHLYHAVYVWNKYAKAWELAKTNSSSDH